MVTRIYRLRRGVTAAELASFEESTSGATASQTWNSTSTTRSAPSP